MPPEEERDALSALVCSKGDAVVLWDAELRVAWISPQARALLEETASEDELQRAAARAWFELQDPDLEEPDPARALKFKSGGGAPIVARFSCIRALEGRTWLLAELRAGRAAHEKLRTLTPAEQRVLNVLAQGLSNREIGQALCLSVETVKTHVSRILAKLDVSSRSKAAKVARDAQGEPHDLTAPGDDPPDSL